MSNTIPKTMWAARLFGPGDVRVVEQPVPSIGPCELLLKTSAAAICGTDLRMIANGYKGVDEDHPLTLGHEFSGVVVQAGSQLQGYPVGTRVSVAPNMGCGACEFCSKGDTHLCARYQAFGINIDGAFAQYVRIPKPAIAQGNVIPLGEGISPAAAAALEPFSCVLNGQMNTGVHLNDTVLLVGAGPIGVMHAMLARILGASRVFVSDLSPQRMEEGARLVQNCTPLYGDLKESLLRETGGQGVDLCIIACPSPQMQAQSLELMKMNGRILYFGGLPAGKDQVTLNTNHIHYKQLTIHGSTRANVAQYRDSLRLLESGALPLEKLITGRFPLERFAQAVEEAKSGRGLKTVITFDE